MICILFFTESLVSVLRWRATFSLLKVSAKSRLVGEMEQLGYLLEAHVGVLQVLSGEGHRHALYPLHRTLAAFLLDDGGEIIR